MQTPNHQWLTSAPTLTVLLRMTLPMSLAIFLLFAYDVLESQLLSNISLEALTALGFTVPVTTAMSAFAIAMTITTNTAVTKALSRDKSKAPSVIINALVLAVILCILFSFVAYLLSPAIFRFLGIEYAMLPDSYHLGPKPDLMPLVSSYMNWRFLGWVFLVLIWQVNSLLRAVGLVGWASGLFVVWLSTKTILLLLWFNDPQIVALAPLNTAAKVHFICDSIFALASLLLLTHKLNLIPHAHVKIRPLYTFKKMSVVGMPATMQQLLTPLSITLLTVLVVSYGQVYVAVLGIIFRLESLLLLLPMVLTTSLPSIVGINWWSGHRQRVASVLFQSKILVVVWQLLIALLLYLYASEVADMFRQEQHVRHSIEHYLTLVPIGFIGAGITIICQSSFNATGHYVKASLLSIAHRMVLKLGCCYIGIEYYGVSGLFIGILTAHLLSALFAFILNRKVHND